MKLLPYVGIGLSFFAVSCGLAPEGNETLQGRQSKPNPSAACKAAEQSLQDAKTQVEKVNSEIATLENAIKGKKERDDAQLKACKDAGGTSCSSKLDVRFTETFIIDDQNSLKILEDRRDRLQATFQGHERAKEESCRQAAMQFDTSVPIRDLQSGNGNGKCFAFKGMAKITDATGRAAQLGDGKTRIPFVLQRADVAGNLESAFITLTVKKYALAGQLISVQMNRSDIFPAKADEIAACQSNPKPTTSDQSNGQPSPIRSVTPPTPSQSKPTTAASYSCTFESAMRGNWQGCVNFLNYRFEVKGVAKPAGLEAFDLKRIVDYAVDQNKIDRAEITSKLLRCVAQNWTVGGTSGDNFRSIAGGGGYAAFMKTCQ